MLTLHRLGLGIRESTKTKRRRCLNHPGLPSRPSTPARESKTQWRSRSESTANRCVSPFQAPASCQRYLSYMTGWLCFTGWQSAITGIGFLVAGIIQGLIILNDANYVPEPYHATLMTIAVVLFCVFVNIFVARRLPLVEGCLAILHFAGLFIVIIILWVLAPRNNAHDAFLQLNNGGGWSSDGLSFMVGLYPLTLCLLGFDSQVHMCTSNAESWSGRS